MQDLAPGVSTGAISITPTMTIGRADSSILVLICAKAPYFLGFRDLQDIKESVTYTF
jgi:hypothetical protein